MACSVLKPGMRVGKLIKGWRGQQLATQEQTQGEKELTRAQREGCERR